MLRRLIMHPDKPVTLRVYRQVMLRGWLSLILILTAIAYIIIDTAFGVSRSLPLYMILASAGLTTLLLNRAGHYRVATIIILLSGNLIVYLLASSEPPSSGVFVFFIPASLAALTLFDYEERRWTYALLAVSMILFLIAYLVDFSILPKGNYSDFYDQINFIINFNIAFIASALIVRYLIGINYTIEKSLQENEARLVKITEELRQSRERFEMALQGTRAGIYEWNVKENTVFLSPIWKEMLGYSMDELREFSAEHLIAMTHPEDLERTQASFSNHLTTGKAFHNELRLRTKSGDYRWFYDSGVSKRNEQGEIITVVGSIINIHARKMAEKKLLEQNELLAKANAELDRFVYSVSHDLRAPLSSVKGLISIAEKTENLAELKAYYLMMHSRIEALEKFIRDIIDYSRNTRLEVDKEPVKLKTLVSDILESLKFSEEMKSVQFHFNFPDDMVLHTDRLRLRMILNNLFTNAIKYHDPFKDKQEVKMQAELNNTHCSITVADNGIGIHEELVPKIFDMFYRASDRSKGSGLGLYIAREAVRKMGGEITVETRLGEGTSFRLSLPVS